MANTRTISVEARVANNMSFMFADLIETLLMVAESEFRKHGREMKHEHKKHFKALLFNAKALKDIVSKNEEATQLHWADDADDMMELMLAFVDRTGCNRELARNFINYIKAFPTVENIDFKKFGV